MSSTSTDSPQPADENQARLLVVEAGGALYGIEGLSLREIVPVGGVTRVPGAPDYVLGIMNVRGTMLTVLDLSRRLRGEPLRAEFASVVIVQANGRMLGLAVDDVLDVLGTGGTELEPAPVASAGTLAKGLGHFGARVVMVIDVNELVRQALA